MAGTQQQITVDYDDIQVQDALNRLLQLTQNTKPVMSEISEYLHERVDDHFEQEEDPDGNPWVPLKEATKKRKKEMGVPVNKILHGQGLALKGLLVPFYDNDEASLSTGPGTEKYAAAQQFGTEDITIAAHNRRVRKVFGRALPFPVWASVGEHRGGIPARPFMGISKGDEREILEILEDEILAQL